LSSADSAAVAPAKSTSNKPQLGAFIKIFQTDVSLPQPALLNSIRMPITARFHRAPIHIGSRLSMVEDAGGPTRRLDYQPRYASY
jgi:hypothetical protein